ERDPGLWQCTHCNISMLIQQAYEVKHYQITTPDWMGTTRYEIKAKVPPGATKEQFHQMLRNLLADQFKLQFHHGQKEAPMFDLVAAKGGPKIKESSEQPVEESKDDGSGPKVDRDGYPIIPKDCSSCATVMNGKARYYATKETIKEFVDFLSDQMGQPVEEKTGLTGKYDFLLSWTVRRRVMSLNQPPAGSPISEDADMGEPIESALQKQLGLKLEAKKGMMDVIVVDGAAKNPAEN
ncbi:MAG TPA: TIGR03435 family protein, partial [Bryobacteraceae bacterium]|nr:TIGR03435 family protein [Bryobacteraceae bacterium]